MQSYIYPARVTQIARDDFVVRFRDVPEAITGGPDRDAALAQAPDALACAIEGYLKLGRQIPSPSAALAGEHPVALEPAIAAMASTPTS